MERGIERAKICKTAPKDFKFGMSRECIMPTQNNLGPDAHAGGKWLAFSKILV